VGLPVHNPIDAEWLARGAPIDHIGTITLPCQTCGKETTHEHFRIIVGTYVGVGAPFFVKPFLKHVSTRGKAGGVRGEVSQCTICDGLWPTSDSGADALVKLGLPRTGLAHPDHLYE